MPMVTPMRPEAPALPQPRGTARYPPRCASVPCANLYVGYRTPDRCRSNTVTTDSSPKAAGDPLGSWFVTCCNSIAAPGDADITASLHCSITTSASRCTGSAKRTGFNRPRTPQLRTAN